MDSELQMEEQYYGNKYIVTYAGPSSDVKENEDFIIDSNGQWILDKNLIKFIFIDPSNYKLQIVSINKENFSLNRNINGWYNLKLFKT